VERVAQHPHHVRLRAYPALQEIRTHFLELCLFQLYRTAPFGYGAQSVDAALIEQSFPCVHRLARYANGQSHFGAALASMRMPVLSGSQRGLRMPLPGLALDPPACPAPASGVDLGCCQTEGCWIHLAAA